VLVGVWLDARTARSPKTDGAENPR
jgi:hypothetical protein